MQIQIFALCLISHLALLEAGEQGQGTAWGTHVSEVE
jgi:hypothetical protein